MRNHDWCRDVQRDEAVRAAEDGRSGPLPTLEEAIAMIPKTASASSAPEQENKGDSTADRAEISRAGQFTPPEAPQGQKCTERESVTDRRPVQPGGGGNVTSFDEPAKCSAAVSETGQGQSGMRTERVTLEITHFRYRPVAEWAWPHMIRLEGRGESVRVVDEDRPGVMDDDGDRINMSWKELAEFLQVERDKARAERDAAIRERDEAKQRADRDAVKCIALADKVIGLKARVAELESAAKAAPAANADGGSNHAAPAASDAAVDPVLREARLRDESRMEAYVASLEEASGAAGTEVVAYFVKWADKDWGVQDQTFRTLERAQDYIKDEKSEDENPQIIPLYAAPQPSPGWLTQDERRVLKRVSEHLFETSQLDFTDIVTLDALLARSSPPEVVLPGDCGGESYDSFVAGWRNYRDEALKALATAGVTVKEVGRE